MRTGNTVANNVVLTCVQCGHTATVKEWDDTTYRNCTSRQMRRDYVSLTRKIAYIEATDTYYQCSSCGAWIGGWLFGTHTED